MEIEKYKLEMAKSEENMKKALMRGVCALNLEAMSIFNETMSGKPSMTPSSSLNGLASSAAQQMPTMTQQPSLAKAHNGAYASHTSTSNAKSQNLMQDFLTGMSHLKANASEISKENSNLAKKVKSFCEKSLNDSVVDPNYGISLSSSKVKKKLSNSASSSNQSSPNTQVMYNSQRTEIKHRSKSPPSGSPPPPQVAYKPALNEYQQSFKQQKTDVLTINPNIVSHSRLSGTNKLFDELVEHSNLETVIRRHTLKF
jgi:hypothetical protein